MIYLESPEMTMAPAETNQPGKADRWVEIGSSGPDEMGTMKTAVIVALTSLPPIPPLLSLR